MNVYEVIPAKYHKTLSHHKSITGDLNKSILSAGFIKKTYEPSEPTLSLFNYYGALLLLDGTGIYVEPSGYKRKIYPGTFIQRLPYREHFTIQSENTVWYETFFCFGMELFNALDNLNIIRHEPVLYPGLHTGLIRSFVSFYNKLQNTTYEDTASVIPQAIDLLVSVYQQDKAKNTSKNTTIIELICEYIDTNISKQLSIQDLSNQFNMSSENFRKIFKQKMGISPGKYIIQRRINKAQDILTQSENSIKSIALSMGYPDAYSFSKQFKKFAGISPSRFRELFN